MAFLRSTKTSLYFFPFPSSVFFFSLRRIFIAEFTGGSTGIAPRPLVSLCLNGSRSHLLPVCVPVLWNRRHLVSPVFRSRTCFFPLSPPFFKRPSVFLPLPCYSCLLIFVFPPLLSLEKRFFSRNPGSLIARLFQPFLIFHVGWGFGRDRLGCDFFFSPEVFVPCPSFFIVVPKMTFSEFPLLFFSRSHLFFCFLVSAAFFPFEGKTIFTLVCLVNPSLFLESTTLLS